MQKIERYEYDISPTEKKEIVLTFKVGNEDCEMAIPKKDLENMLWYANNPE